MYYRVDPLIVVGAALGYGSGTPVVNSHQPATSDSLQWRASYAEFSTFRPLLPRCALVGLRPYNDKPDAGARFLIPDPAAAQRRWAAPGRPTRHRPVQRPATVEVLLRAADGGSRSTPFRAASGTSVNQAGVSLEACGQFAQLNVAAADDHFAAQRSGAASSMARFERRLARTRWSLQFSGSAGGMNTPTSRGPVTASFAGPPGTEFHRVLRPQPAARRRRVIGPAATTAKFAEATTESIFGLTRQVGRRTD